LSFNQSPAHRKRLVKPAAPYQKRKHLVSRLLVSTGMTK
jgi:hypothetical protein